MTSIHSSPTFLDPLSLESFFSNYWEKQALHIERCNDKFQSLISVGEIEQFLSTQPVFFPGIQLSHSGNPIEVSSYADAQNQILPLRLFDHHNDGATIVISQAQKLFAPLSELCRECTKTLQMRCQANIYLSPPGNQGFNAHYDTHDVFILQVDGAKSFNFYPSPVELPCPDEQFDASRLTNSPIDESIALKRGDTPYIPRGVVHDAIADNNSPSLHVTLGVYPVIARDIINEAVDLLTQQDSRFRHSIAEHLALPPSSESLADRQSGLSNSIGSLIDSMAKNFKSEPFIRQLNSRLLDELSLDTQQDCRGITKKQARIPSSLPLSAPATLNISEDVLLSYERTETGVKVRTFGQVLEFTEPVASVVNQLCETGSLNVEDLSTLEVEQSNALVERLLRENLVELS